MRYDLWQGDREKAEVIEGKLKKLIQPLGETGKVTLKLWKPKATKPYVHYSFKTREEAEEYAKKAVAGQQAHKQMVNERKAARAGTPEMLEQVKVGDIFVSSWGYDQTNVDFYQITERRGHMALLKPISAKSCGLTGNGMADYVTAVKDGFLDEGRYPAKWHRIQFSSGRPVFTVRSFAWADPWDGKQQYRSWYA